MKRLPEGCGYQGYEFGAAYPDSICCGGRLYDADNCDGKGNLYEPAEDIPCPMCRKPEAITYWYERNMLSGISSKKAMAAAVSLVTDIHQNRKNGTEPWKQAEQRR
jgi:hypothetical protein